MSNETKNVTAPVDVLAVLEEVRALAADQRDINDDNNNKPMADSWESLRADVVKARAAVAEQNDALKLAERTLANWLKASGYKAGACTDEWVPEVRDAVAALVPIRAAVARVGSAS